MITFNRYSPTSSLYVLSESNDDIYIAYYMIGPREAETPATPESVSLKASWKDYNGYYVLLRNYPPNVGAVETKAGQCVTGKVQDQTGFLWLEYKDDAYVEMGYIEMHRNPPPPSEEEPPPPPPDVPDVVTIAQICLEFGGYRLPLGKGTRVVFKGSDADPEGFVFEYPQAPDPASLLCPADATVPDPDAAGNIYMLFLGATMGCFQGLTFIGDYNSDECTSWNLALRYAVKMGDDVVHQFYPIFDLPKGTGPLLWMCWDPTNQLKATRTYFSFLGKSIELILDGTALKCLRMIANGDIIPTFFRTVTGEVIGFIPQIGGTNPARLVFELRTPTDGNPNSARYYLVPSGGFEMVLIEPNRKAIAAADRKAEFPARLLCGLAGVESVLFNPRNGAIAGDQMVFYPAKPAYVPVFPVVHPKQAAVATGGEVKLITDLYRTAWIAVTNGARAVYCSQPEDAPLYTGEFGDASGILLDLFEPTAACLPTPAATSCYPAVPVVGAVPSRDLPAADTSFVRKLEYQIICPWRREIIRAMTDGLDPCGLECGVGATEQGLIATTCGGTWGELLLAVNKKTNTTIKFTGLDHDLQSAFQSNQLFLVATTPQHISAAPRSFKSIVYMDEWTFDLDVGRNTFDGGQNKPAGDFTDLNNTVLFKFSPGKIIDRIRDPRSWTNPGSFNRTNGQLLDQLATRLAAFFDAVDAMDVTVRTDYAALKRVINQDDWTGIIGINVRIDPKELPSELVVLAAGIPDTRLVAHHIVVETSTLYHAGNGLPLVPGECSLFGLIDYSDPTLPEPTGDFEFKVTRLRALFTNGALKEFQCDAAFFIKKLFGENATTPKRIDLKGTRETHTGEPTYMFTMSEVGTISLVSKVLDQVAVRKAEFSLSEEYDDLDNLVELRCAFAFWGDLSFKPLQKSSGLPAQALDLFTYDKLAFEGMGVRMKVTFVQNVPVKKFSFDVAGLSFDSAPPSMILRPNGLVQRFPMKLQKFLTSNDVNQIRMGGYVEVTTDASFDAVAGTWYGLEYSLNLGTLGEFAGQAGLTVGLLLAWSSSATDPHVTVGLKFPGVSAASNDLFTINGVLKLAASQYQLKTYPEGGGVGYMLMLGNMALRVLSVKLPPAGPNIYIFGPPGNVSRPVENSLGWLVYYTQA